VQVSVHCAAALSRCQTERAAHCYFLFEERQTPRSAVFCVDLLRIQKLSFLMTEQVSLAVLVRDYCRVHALMNVPLVSMMQLVREARRRRKLQRYHDCLLGILVVIAGVVVAAAAVAVAFSRACVSFYSLFYCCYFYSLCQSGDLPPPSSCYWDFQKHVLSLKTRNENVPLTSLASIFTRRAEENQANVTLDALTSLSGSAS